IVQAYGWTAVGAKTQEAVYIEGTDNPGTWSQCGGTTGACNSPCAGIIPSIPCNNVWHIVPTTGSMSKASGAERPDGLPTRRVTAISNMTSLYDSYVPACTSGARLFGY